jgi:hypothetical protein
MASAPLYRHSGKISLVGLLAGAAATFVGGPVLATIYSVAIAYIPFIYLNAILSGVFGAGVGFVVAFAMKSGKVRNTWLIMTMAFGATLFAHYIGWMVWVAVMFFRADAEVPVLALLFPPTFFEIVGELASEGVWTIGRSDTPVSGFFLWLVWCIEALVVFGASLVVAFTTAEGEPFCEACENWCRAHEDVLRLTGHADSGALSTRVLAHDLSVLTEATRPDPSEQTWHQVDLCLCDKCGGTNTLTLSHVTLSYDKKGNAQTKKRSLVERMLLSNEQSSWVRGVASSAPAPATVPIGR